MSELFDYVTKEFINTHEFTADMPNVEVDFNEISFRPRPGDKLPPTPEDMQLKLRQRFSSINATAFKNFAQMEVRCDIKENTMRSYIKGRRSITIFAVAKLCVGAKLSVEATIELFKMYGHIIDTNSYRFDAIVIDAVKCKDDIDVFYETCAKFGLQNILDKLSHD